LSRFLAGRAGLLARPLLLVIAMIAVLAAVGWLLAGAEGVVWSLALAALLLVLMPTTSPDRLLRVHGARALHPLEAPALFEAVRTLARRAGLAEAPAVYLLPGPTPQALTSHSEEGASLGVSQGLLRLLSPREVVAVLAHELSHLERRDLGILRIAEVVQRVTRTMSLVGLVFLLLSLPLALLGDVEVPFAGVLFLVAAPWVVGMLALALSRSRELDADLGAVALTGDPLALASALTKIEAAAQRSPLARLLVVPSVFRTHPRTDERVKRLLAMAEAATPRTSPSGTRRKDELIEPIWRRRPRTQW
jgi:heat shock protein HtpX